MADVMAECCHPKDSAPVSKLFSIRELWQELTNGVGQVLILRHNIENPTGQFHHAKRVLKPAVGCAGIDQISQRELVNMPEALERTRIENLPLFRAQLDENVNGVS